MRPATKINNLGIFETLHPSAALIYFAATLTLTMLSFQPLLLAINFVGALLLSVYLRGLRTALKTLLWQLPMILLCALINPLFSGRGSTELLRLFNQAIYLESVAYGACMGLMLAAVMLWFICASNILDSSKVMAVLGSALPTLALMISMALSLVPQFLRRFRVIANTANAVPAAKPKGRIERIQGRLNMMSVLMAWSMEDSLERADAMKARGYGAVHKRTQYRARKLRLSDVNIALGLGVFALVCLGLTWLASSQYHFYPALSQPIFWWGYLPYTAFVLLPVFVGLADDLSWRRVK